MHCTVLRHDWQGWTVQLHDIQGILGYSIRVERVGGKNTMNEHKKRKKGGGVSLRPRIFRRCRKQRQTNSSACPVLWATKVRKSTFGRVTTMLRKTSCFYKSSHKPFSHLENTLQSFLPHSHTTHKGQSQHFLIINDNTLLHAKATLIWVPSSFSQSIGVWARCIRNSMKDTVCHGKHCKMTTETPFFNLHSSKDSNPLPHPFGSTSLVLCLKRCP